MINLDETVWPPAVKAVPDHHFTWCETCGNPVENDVCVCWTHVAGVLERFMGYDYDRAAAYARTMWGRMSQDDRERVWSAEYADNHDVPTYPEPAWNPYTAETPFRHDRDCDPAVSNCACSGTAPYDQPRTPDCSVTCNCDPDGLYDRLASLATPLLACFSSGVAVVSGVAAVVTVTVAAPHNRCDIGASDIGSDRRMTSARLTSVAVMVTD